MISTMCAGPSRALDEVDAFGQKTRNSRRVTSETSAMRCHFCKDGPAAYVTFRHNVGMLFLRRVYTTHSRMCRDCARRAFWHHQLRNVVLGWWGIISFFLTGWFLVGNTARYVLALRSIGREERERNALADAGEEATELDPRLAAFEVNVVRRLRDGECPTDIAADLADAIGVSTRSAERFVAEVGASEDMRASA